MIFAEQTCVNMTDAGEPTHLHPHVGLTRPVALTIIARQ